VPAGAVIQNPQALPGFIGRKGSVGGKESWKLKLIGLTFEVLPKLLYLRALGVSGTDGVGVKSVDIIGNTKSEGS
jgi:hypothetical protein